MQRLALAYIFAMYLLTSPESSISDQLELINGDIIQGTLISKSDDYLLWMSTMLGELSVKSSLVSNIHSKATLDPLLEMDPSLQNVITKPKYTGDMSISGSSASGNQSRRDWNIDVRLERRAKQLRQIGLLEYENHNLDNIRASDAFEISYAADWFFKDRWFLRNELSFATDEVRAVELRYGVGSALGLQLMDSMNSQLSVESGLMWLSEEQKLGVSSDNLTWSWSLYYSLIIWDNITIAHRQNVNVAIADFKDSESDFDVSLRLPLIDNLFAELKFEWLYDNQPAPGKDLLDTQFSMGINYSW
ncbi:MAG: hypothetical protein CBC09_03355 [Cellvibrionales bacterium TMED49]|nr:hypothetical protein [Porticoccaceae bacterium]OUU39159.1 MAG: hypothetical protein CBC09_03355 [Cellvibrionales bacterium TMED49]